MLSPTLALRCAQCQHVLALSDLRGAEACPQCGAPHGVPASVIDSLALYEAALRQSALDAAAAGAPADAPPAAPAADAPPVADAPVPDDMSLTPAPISPATLLGWPVPQPEPRPAAAPSPVLAGLLAAPRTAVPAPPSAASTLSAPLSSAPSNRLFDAESPPISAPPAALSQSSGVAGPDTLPGARPVGASNSSLMSVLSASSATTLSDAPLLVAVVREPGPTDTQPARPPSDLAAAVRRALPDRAGEPPAEAEGRIPAAALAIARRTLLARYADERRQQQVRDGSLALVFAAIFCVFFLLAGMWYVAVPIALVAILLRLRREERSERFGAEVQRLADALQGQRIAAYDAITAWFDALWPAPVSAEAMWTSHLHGAVRCEVHGYAALLDVHLNEKTSGGQVYPPRITAYLAAIWPGRVPSLRLTAVDLPQSAQARLSRLRKAGYTVTADANGGLVMRVSESIAAAACQDITRLPALQVPIGELAALARDLGAEPVAAP